MCAIPIFVKIYYNINMQNECETGNAYVPPAANYRTRWSKLERPHKIIWGAIGLGVLFSIFSFVTHFPYAFIVQGCVLSFVLGVGYTYRCLFRKFDEVTVLQDELLGIKMELVERSLGNTLDFFEDLAKKAREKAEDEEGNGTIH